MIIRKETEGDYGVVNTLIEAAFGRVDEALLVAQLRLNPRYIPELSLVAEDEGVVVGHILFTPVEIVSGELLCPSLALAPVAVLPEYQRKGVGSALIRTGFQEAETQGYTSVIVLGHPEYYVRFGFIPAGQFGIEPPLPKWKSAFFAKELVGGALRYVSGTVHYLPEFGV